MLFFLRKKIKSIDTYGKGISFNIKGKDQSQSFFGGFCTIVNNIIFWVLFLMNFYNFLFEKYNNPIIDFQSQIRDFSGNQTIRPQDLKFVMGIYNITRVKDQERPNIQPILVKPTFTKFVEVLKGNNSKVLSAGEIKKCDGHLYRDDLKFMKILDVLKLPELETCVYLNRTGVEIGGNMLTHHSESTIELEQKFSLCEIAGKEEGCNITHHHHTFKHLKALFFYKNSYVDKIKTIGHDYTYQIIPLDFNFMADYDIDISAKTAYISTDWNWIFNLIPSDDTHIFKMEVFPHLDIIPAGGKIMERRKHIKFHYHIRLDDHNETYERSYIKLDDLMANVGSILSLVEFFTIFIADYFTEGNLEHSIYKQIYFTGNKLNMREKHVSNLNKNFTIKDNNLNNNKNNEYELKSVKKKEKNDKEIKENNEANIINNNNLNASNNISIRSNANFKNEENEMKNIVKENNNDLNNREVYNLNITNNKEMAKKQRKYLKENLIKKTNFVKIYQIIPKFFKSNDIQRLINIQDFIEKELDIINILRKLIEYENFKKLFLNNNQIQILNLMQRRIISKEIIDDEADEFYKKFFFDNTLKDNMHILKIYEELNVKKENEKTKKIMDNLNEAYDLFN